ncbi:Uncharacterised protein [Staphylococcus aureus]|nr:Uncharacterised protein [Staphylococcus aureus]
MNAIQNSISLRKILVVSLSILTILSMVLDFNFKEAQAQNKNNIADKNSGDCFYSEVLNSYGELLTGNIITAVFEDVKAKNLKGVAKKLAKIGIKGNLAGIAATMVSKDVQCNLKYGLL